MKLYNLTVTNVKAKRKEIYIHSYNEWENERQGNIQAYENANELANRSKDTIEH